MILYEHEGKQILFNGGINIPTSQLVSSDEEEIIIKLPVVLKAQVLSGKRAEVGGIAIVEDQSKLKGELTELLGSVINKEKVDKVLVEEKIDYQEAFYLSISYDTETRGPILSLSKEGGTGIEEKSVEKFAIDPLNPFLNLPKDLIDIEFLKKTITIFFDQDLLLLEINPLVKDKSGRLVALDAKLKLDDTALKRHEKDWNFPPRSAPGHTPTQNEIEAKKIDAEDYRGTAGSAYFDLDGDIAVLSSGGGVSLTAMDALIASGGKPANFTEYSGNPPKEKVVKLTKIVLSKPNIHGLWVIGTVVANFTDIYETLAGLVEGLRQAQAELETKFNFPIVIRRGGPRDTEAYQMLKKVKDFNLYLQGEETSITKSAEVMAKLAKEYELKNG
ncbi:acetate--CoA ligase family protein [Candidatus Daviesbacteria bacterium]|nr:acetate--CoA ligase family protein [Candidatus Daviesbacteria bacterium]